MKYERAKHKLETKINDIKYELLSEVQQNTQKLDELNEFSNQSRHLEESLNQTQKNWGDDISGGSLFEPEEKAKLVDIVSIQSREIEALREEIRVLSLKGGHILPPAQPPNMLAGSL
ncbi:PREDICTED: uncharacterized protein LOC109589719 [Amphimedon queenslandica]|nr:PREDICTED: uncharacterized protein LOC109589719 [Amphimedon queenslandica]|eukprot:XP_019861313.1 PREDICTED: uncharacterized protein LOC109589719 [Amphimedon queenslandica]